MNNILLVFSISIFIIAICVMIYYCLLKSADFKCPTTPSSEYIGTPVGKCLYACDQTCDDCYAKCSLQDEECIGKCYQEKSDCYMQCLGSQVESFCAETCGC